MSLFYISEARFCDPVVHAVYSVPMSALIGFMVPRRPLVAELSYDGRALACGPYSLKVVTSRFARYLGIAVETVTDPCD